MLVSDLHIRGQSLQTWILVINAVAWMVYDRLGDDICDTEALIQTPIIDGLRLFHTHTQNEDY